MLHEDRIRAVLSCCQYAPTKEKLDMLASKYEAEESVHAFSCMDGDAITGDIILQQLYNDSFEILGIAVDPTCRSRGIGKMMITQAAALLSCRVLKAETDGDAVGFYQKCGFEIQTLGEKYPGIMRYVCTWKRK